ncbi:hypothetical protein ACFQX7_13035 [Luedemannella flava]
MNEPAGTEPVRTEPTAGGTDAPRSGLRNPAAAVRGIGAGGLAAEGSCSCSRSGPSRCSAPISPAWPSP